MLANPAMLQFVGLSPSQITAECHRRIDSLPDGALLRWSFAPLASNHMFRAVIIEPFDTFNPYPNETN